MMLELSRLRPSPAAIISLVALFAALGGTAAALTGHNSVRSDDIRDGAVRSTDIHDNAVTGADVREASLRGSQISGVNATRLGGRPAGAFLSSDSELSNVVDVNPAASTSTTVLNVPSLGTLVSGPSGCNAGAKASSLIYSNTTGGPVSATGSTSAAAGGAGFEGTLASPGEAGLELGSGPGNGASWTIQLAGKDAVATIEVSVINGGDPASHVGNVCRYIAHGTSTG